MDPIAFEIFGLEIRWYAIIITFAMLLGVFLVSKQGKKEGFVENDLMDIFLCAFPLAIVGARLYYVLFRYSVYKGDFFSMLNIRQGGLAIHGGLIGAFIGGYFIIRKYGLNMWTTLDLYAPYISLGQSIGRWGNFMNQEAHGGPTNFPWGIMIDGVKVHPTFLYESILDFMLFLFLINIRKNKKFDGEMVSIYLIVYSIGRFFIEGLRTDSLMLGSFRIAQTISIMLIIIGFGIWAIRKNKKLDSPYFKNK